MTLALVGNICILSSNSLTLWPPYCQARGPPGHRSPTKLPWKCSLLGKLSLQDLLCLCLCLRLF
jgi:hypothetical protein